MANYYGNDNVDSTALPYDNYYLGAGDDSASGTPGPNQLYGGEGNDLLTGGAPNGGTGSGASAMSPIRNTAFQSSGNDYVDGGPGIDALYGADGDDAIYGGDGNDAGVIFNSGLFFVAGLFGGEGNDTIYGGGGDDLIEGGLGRDVLLGGEGADIFAFNTIGESVKGSRCDVIRDFDRSEGDRIDLSGIDANAMKVGDQSFRFIGKKPFHDKSGELRFKKGILSGDVDGNGKADFAVKVAGVGKLSDGDFQL